MIEAGDGPLRRRALSSWTIGRAAVCVVAVTLAIVWVLKDHTPPSYDQSHYLDISLHYVRAFDHAGVRGLLDALGAPQNDPGRAPMLPLLIAPFLALFGSSVRSALFLNVLLWPMLLLSVAGVGRLLFDRRTALLAMFVTATIPMIVGLSHQVLQDFLLVAISTAAIFLLLHSRSFERTAPSIALAVALVAGWLTKVTFPALVAGPAALVVGRALVATSRELRDPNRRRIGRRRLANLGGTGVIVAAVAAAWYVPNWKATREYIRWSTTGEGALGAHRPFRVFHLHLLSDDIGSFIVVVTIAAGVVCLAQWARRSTRLGDALRGDAGFRAAFLALWVVVPYAVVAPSRNNDPRYIISVMPAVAVIAAGLVCKIRARHLRASIAGALCAGCAFQTIALVTRVDLPGLPAQVLIPTPVGDAVVPLSSVPLGASQLPQSKDRAAPVFAYLVSASAGAPRTVCVLQVDRAINPNTLNWLADARRVPLAFVDQRSGPDLRDRLASCDFIVYIPVDDVVGVDTRRIALDNVSAAAAMDESLMAMFRGRARSFPSSSDERAQVLERSP